ncbi:hypothetical protein pb186bvf_014136 [Paramecium bursaria]
MKRLNFLSWLFIVNNANPSMIQNNKYKNYVLIKKL